MDHQICVESQTQTTKFTISSTVKPRSPIYRGFGEDKKQR